MTRLNKNLEGQLLSANIHTTQFFRGKFLVFQKFSNSPFELSIDPAFIKEIANR